MPEADGRTPAEVLVEFARGLSENHSVEAVLQSLGDFCTELLPVDGVGVLLVEEAQLTVATTNSPEGDAIEQLEVELGEGPCMEAVRTGKPVLVPDLEEVRERYPQFTPRALETGVRAIQALPLTGRGELVGALDIMNRQPTELTPTQLGTAQMLADVAVSYLFTVRLHQETSRLADQLQSALDSRVFIEQAKGILAERYGETTDLAFERLREHARKHRLKIRAVAGAVVEGQLRL